MDSEPNQVSGQAEAPQPVGCVRRGLYILILALAILSLTSVSIYLLWVQPLSAENRVQAGELEAAEAELQDLRPLVVENETLRSVVEQGELRLLVLTALVDVNSARVSLALGDSQAAEETLDSIEHSLSALQSRLEGENARAAGQMRDRLSLVLGEIGTDAFAAQRDLEVLANDLSQLAEGVRED